MYHSPVMPQESIDSLNILSDGIYVDLTFGGGGHSKLILNNLSSKGKLIAFDQDTDAFQNKIDDSRFILINQNFKFLQQNLKYNNVLNVDGVFADLGVSSHQFDSAVRGFSIRYDSEIDMRMNTNSSFDAQEILNEYSESQLSNILFEYADLRNSKEISKTIVEARTIKKITRTSQLNEILSSFLPKGFENKILAKIYQALRIEVNQEMHALKEVLLQLPSLVNKGGIISFITYHSIEDRIVKRFIQNGCFESEPLKNEFGVADIPFKKTFKFLVPTKKEIKLKYELEKNVNLVKFERNRIEISFNDNLDKDFVKDLSAKLFEWTSERWIITFSKSKGEMSVKEKQKNKREELINEVKNSEIYKTIIENFPDAELTDVKLNKKED